MRISFRIDRAFGNAAWHGTFSDVVVDYMNPGLSDHTPLLLSYKVNMQKGGRTFKFFNYMADHDHFLQAVQKGGSGVYSGSTMLKVWGKLKSVKSELKTLHSKDFSQFDEKIECCKRELDVIQSAIVSNPADGDAEEAEKGCIGKLKLFLKVQESAYKQKSRIQWL